MRLLRSASGFALAFREAGGPGMDPGMGRDDDASVARLYAQVAGVILPSPKA